MQAKLKPHESAQNLQQPTIFEEHIWALKDSIMATLSKIDQIREQDDFKKHYSFAVKFLIKEEQQLHTYRMT